jgi:trimeric autotransporter adhesin
MRPRCFPCVPRSILVSVGLSLFLSLFAVSSPAQIANSVEPVPSRLTQPIDEKQLVTLQGSVHRLANAANDRGAAEDGMQLDRIQVVLKRSSAQESALKQMIADMHTPGTAMYHKWLTPAQFGQQFGPSDADIETLTNWLGTHGFRVTKVNAGKQTLEMSGTSGQFRSTFHSQIHKYQVDGQMHYAGATNPQIPAAMAPVFGGFASLNNFQLKSHIKTLGSAQFDAKTHKVAPAWTEGTNGVNFVLAPGDFAVQYNLNPLYAAGTTGKGQTIAIINESNISIALVNQYRSLFGLPVNPPTVIIDGNDPGIDGINNPEGPNGASGEAYLDVEQSGAVAPGANIDLVIGGDTALASGLLLAAEHAVFGDVAPVLSLSFGGCEADEGGENAFWSELWSQAAAQGQTVMVSSGDSGSAGCDNDNTQQYAVGGQAVSGIASTPYNVAVGGTDFFYSSYNGTSDAVNQQLGTYWNLSPSNSTPTVSLLQVIPEQPWNDSQYGLNLANQFAEGLGTTIAGGGGGASNCATGSPTQAFDGSGGTCAGYPKPTWQTALTPADTVRDLPDVALFAANGDNFSFYPICAADGDCQAAPAGGEVQITGVGGTSASTPAFAGIMALVNQKYGPQGQADFVLYPLAQQFPTAFNDVANGTNSVPCADTPISLGISITLQPVDCLAVSNPAMDADPTFGPTTEGQIGTATTPEYNAVAGYDLASGLGTINANVLVTNWGNVKFTSSTVTLTPSQTSFAHGTAITLSGAVTPGTATGNVALTTTSTEPLNAEETTFPLSGGQYSGIINYLPGGTYDIYGVYGGDGANAPSTSSKTSITVTPEASSTTLVALNTTGNSAVSNGATLPYGTQILLEGLPGSMNPNTTTTVPTGSVTFLNGTTAIGTVQVNGAGEAEFSYAPPPGTTLYSVTAQYSGDNSYNASTSSALTFTIGKDTPAINLSSSSQTTNNITGVAGTTALTVQVENEANAANQNNTGAAFVNPAASPTGAVTVSGLPSGTLTFPALQSALDPFTLFIEGVATLPLPAETAGTYSVTVSYLGDTHYAAVTQTFSVTLTAPSGIASTTTVSASPTATSTTAVEAVTTTVTGTTAGGVPSGTLTFLSSGNTLGAILLPGGSGDSVTATITLSSAGLLQGANVITVQYSGNGVYAPSSGTATVTNGGAGTQGFTLSNGGQIAIASQGGSGTSTITVMPTGGFTGSVALSCAVTPATNATCSVSAPAVITSATAVTAMLTVTTMANSAAIALPKIHLLPIGGGVAMASLLFFLVPVRRRRWTTLLGAVVLMVVVGFSAGCNGARPTAPSVPITVTVAGTSTGVTTQMTAVSVMVN